MQFSLSPSNSSCSRLARKKNWASSSSHADPVGTRRINSWLTLTLNTTFPCYLTPMSCYLTLTSPGLLLRVDTECNKSDLGVNGPKTRYLTYNIDEHPPLARHSCSISGHYPPWDSNPRQPVSLHPKAATLPSELIGNLLAQLWYKGAIQMQARSLHCSPSNETQVPTGLH